MEARQVAGVARERVEAVDAAVELELDRQTGGELRQARHGEVVARVQAQRALAGADELGLELARELGELRRDALARLLLELEEPGPQRRQARAPAALEAGERLAERALPPGEQVPDVPIREADLARRRRERARALDRAQQCRQRGVGRLRRELPGEVEPEFH